MAAPLAIPAAALLKGLIGKLGVKAAGKAVAGMAGKRMAGEAIKQGATKGLAPNLLSKLVRGTTPKGFAKNLGIPMTKQDVAFAVVPDVAFGGLTALMTPGDLGDKAIAGVGSAAGGIAGGLGARGLLGPRSNLGILAAEMGGGMAGDMAGMSIADQLIRAKGGGMTPMEKEYAVADQQYRAQLEEDILRQYGLA